MCWCSSWAPLLPTNTYRPRNRQAKPANREKKPKVKLLEHHMLFCSTQSPTAINVRLQLHRPPNSSRPASGVTCTPMQLGALLSRGRQSRQNDRMPLGLIWGAAAAEFEVEMTNPRNGGAGSRPCVYWRTTTAVVDEFYCGSNGAVEFSQGFDWHGGVRSRIHTHLKLSPAQEKQNHIFRS